MAKLRDDQLLLEQSMPISDALYTLYNIAGEEPHSLLKPTSAA